MHLARHRRSAPGGRGRRRQHPWLEIGSFAENHWAFICCDSEDPLFGAVVERKDSTPWSDIVWDEEVHADMLEFLQSLIPRPE
ncbi:MAG: hypothetical protein H6734_14620 [Alphaproteobacteria bacterium]|nr:hypothetical protein [Alphaproteobacteria bacterium]